MLNKQEIKDLLKNNKQFKTLFFWSIYRRGGLIPRWWVRNILNRFFHKKGKNVIIKSRNSRHDLYPWHKFEVGNDSTIETFTVINNGAGDVIIGNKVLIGIGTVLIGPVTIGDGSGTGQHVFISGFNHGYSDPDTDSRLQPLDRKPIVLGVDVHIGSNSVVLAGVTIGDKTQVGAGSVVTRDIPAFSVAAGNPARVLKKFNSETRQWEKA
jgi:acetyltransferase-like isoleucine patch superfamily enzyme